MSQEEYKRYASAYHILLSKQLNWINCDRFINEENVDKIILNLDSTGNPFVRLIFYDINAIVEPVFEENKFVFNNVPVGKSVKILAIKKVDKAFHYAEKDIITDNEISNVSLDFQELEKTEIEGKLELI